MDDEVIFYQLFEDVQGEAGSEQGRQLFPQTGTNSNEDVAAKTKSVSWCTY